MPQGARRGLRRQPVRAGWSIPMASRRRARDYLSAAERAEIWKFVLSNLRQPDAAEAPDSRRRADPRRRARRRPESSDELPHLRRVEGAVARDYRRPAAISRRPAARLTARVRRLAVFSL